MADDKMKTEVEEEVRISPRTGKPIDMTKSHKRKPKKKPSDYSPVIGMNGYNLEDGDNTKFLQLNTELFNMPNIDVYNVEEVEQRLNEYFALYAKYDMKPTVVGMAMSLGMDRSTLRCVAKDLPMGGNRYKSALPKSVAAVIKKAYFLLENLWENYMLSGKINPVTGIFLGKNHYNYQDKTEYIVTPNQKSIEDYSIDDIKQRYLTASEKKALPDKND